MGVDDLVRQVAERQRQAAQARIEADAERRRSRRENDHYVTGGVHWNGYGLKTLIRMVAERASPGQLDALADEWRGHGSALTSASAELRRSLDRLAQYWSGASADDAMRAVTRDVVWIAELGETAQEMAMPIEDAGGALRSAQDTMPGSPRDAWYATAGGGAAVGFVLGGPVGAAIGAALGGIASAFGFGSNEKKLKRKAVQTMQRYEAALLGIDQSTPQFGAPSAGVDPGTDRVSSPGGGVGTPTPTATPPGAGLTTPSFSGDYGGRWQGLTGMGPGGGPAIGGPGAGPGGWGPGGSGFPGRTGRGSPTVRGTSGRGVGGVPLAPSARGAGQDGTHRSRGRGGGAYGSGGVGAGARGGLGGDREYRARGRFARAGLDPHGGYGGAAGGARQRGEDDTEHYRRFPVEEDPFSSDLKAAPPVIGL